MKPVKDFPYHCKDCRWWRYNRTEQTHICHCFSSPYSGEQMHEGDCCVKFEKKEERKQ